MTRTEDSEHYKRVAVKGHANDECYAVHAVSLSMTFCFFENVTNDRSYLSNNLFWMIFSSYEMTLTTHKHIFSELYRHQFCINLFVMLAWSLYDILHT